MIDIRTAVVPASRIQRTTNSVSPPLFGAQGWLKLTTVPMMTRKKCWLACGNTSPGTPALKLNAAWRFLLNGTTVLEIPYQYDGTLAQPTIMPANFANFGSASNALFDEPIFGDLNGGTFTGACPWRLNITCDEVRLDIGSLVGGGTHYGFLVVQEEMPY